MTRKRGSIALARQLCYEIAGATNEDDDISGSDYGSVDVAEILSAEVERLREALAQPERRKPLTDEEIRRIKPVSPDLVDFRSGVRCAEAAHGIKE